MMDQSSTGKKHVSARRVIRCSSMTSHVKSFENHSIDNQSHEDYSPQIDPDSRSTSDHLRSSNVDNEQEAIPDEHSTDSLPYYHSDLDRGKSESILRIINRAGCFLIRNHRSDRSSPIESPYVLSLVGPTLNISHYLLYRIHRRLFIKPFSSESYNSVKELVEAHRHDPGVFPCALVEYPIRLESTSCHSSVSSISSSSSTSSTKSKTNKVMRQQIIGRGHFGVVYKGLYNGDIPVAIKTYSTSCRRSEEKCEADLLSEAQTMVDLDHSHLVYLYGITRCHNRLCLVTEYMSNGCLLFWLQRQQHSTHTSLLRRRLALFSLQICDAMIYLETKLIIHRDLAARNCLIGDNDQTVKVSDFGMARRISSSSDIYQERSDSPFPLRWSSPEVLFRREYSIKSDIWSYGVLLWEMYTLGDTPFGKVISNDRAAQLIKAGQMPNKAPLLNSIAFRQILSPCWTHKPSDRPSFSSLKQLLDKALLVPPRPRSLH